MNANPGSAAGARPHASGRPFTPATAKALADAAVAFSGDPFSGDDALRAAIVSAVSEAHAGGWLGDELITAIRAAIPAEVANGRQRESLELTLKRRAMVAFFGVNDSVF